MGPDSLPKPSLDARGGGRQADKQQRPHLSGLSKVSCWNTGPDCPPGIRKALLLPWSRSPGWCGGSCRRLPSVSALVSDLGDLVQLLAESPLTRTEHFPLLSVYCYKISDVSLAGTPRVSRSDIHCRQVGSERSQLPLALLSLLIRGISGCPSVVFKATAWLPVSSLGEGFHGDPGSAIPRLQMGMLVFPGAISSLSPSLTHL